ncbi:MAG: hypothetical protein MR358_10520 [Clostridiales bacterium]|nr:hypothetical protein [Clostridiales bacterium]
MLPKYKKKDPDRGRKLFKTIIFKPRKYNIKRKTPIGDGNDKLKFLCELQRYNIKRKTPTGDGNTGVSTGTLDQSKIKRKTPIGDGNALY